MTAKKESIINNVCDQVANTNIVKFLTYNVANCHADKNMQNNNLQDCHYIVICLQECNPSVDYTDVFKNMLSWKPSIRFKLVGSQHTCARIQQYMRSRSKLVRVLVFARICTDTTPEKVKFNELGCTNLGIPYLYNFIALFSQVQIGDLKIDIIAVHFNHGSDNEENKRERTQYRLQKRMHDWGVVTEHYEKFDENQRGHLCVLLGDTNFRLGVENSKEIENKHVKWNTATIQRMLKNEELNKFVLENIQKSHGFKEVECITFKPTYKVKKRLYYVQDNYRHPAWTDRILYRTKEPDDKWKIDFLQYRCIYSHIMYSDHLPVQVTAIITRKNSSETVPA